MDGEAVTHAVLAVDGVRHVRRVRSRWIGSERAVDIVVTVDPALSTDASHAIADAVEDAVVDDFGVEDITVHVEPATGEH